MLLALHVGLVVFRIPGKVYGKRAKEIALYRELGAARYLLQSANLGGAQVVEWLRAHVAADHVLLWRGEAKGAFEVMAGLIAPRFLVAEAGVAKDASEHTIVGNDGTETRRLARGVLADGRAGVLVVHAQADQLRLDVR